MCATHLLIMLYLSVKFHQICFSSLGDTAETRLVTDRRTDGQTDGQCDFNMPPEVPLHRCKTVKIMCSQRKTHLSSFVKESFFRISGLYVRSTAGAMRLRAKHAYRYHVCTSKQTNCKP